MSKSENHSNIETVASARSISGAPLGYTLARTLSPDEIEAVSGGGCIKTIGAGFCSNTAAAGTSGQLHTEGFDWGVDGGDNP